MFRTAIAAAVALCSCTVSGDGAELAGTANRIVDGDTFWVCHASACQKIRICGINAPEEGEPGYQESTEALKKLIAGSSVRCIQVGNGTPCDGRSEPTSHDRIVAQCFVHGTDIASALVRQGSACDWVKFSGGAYSHADEGDRCKEPDEADEHPVSRVEACISSGACNYDILTNEERAEVIRRENEAASPAIQWGAPGSGSRPCDHSWQFASDGSACGGRAADMRPGGR
jgi:endonuclease YncB( thermonuclease family)